jgi:glycosyltransferase involved in cell wall biosynthesis
LIARREIMLESMANIIRFSIIVPIFNVSKYLSQCLDSIVNQEYPNFEVVLIDDGSTDDSGKICDKYYSLFPNLIKVIHQKNSGLGQARNRGVEEANGEYLFFIDSDDYLLSNCILSDISNEIVLTKPDCLVIKSAFFDDALQKCFKDKLKFYNKSISNAKRLVKERYYSFSAWSKIIKKTFLVKNGIYFEKGYSEDCLWSAKILAYNPRLSSLLSKDIYCYRINRKGSITNVYQERATSDWAKILFDCYEIYKTGVSKALRLYFAVTYFHLFMSLSKFYPNSENTKLISELYETKILIKNPYDIKSFILKWSLSIIGVKKTMKLCNKLKK